MSWPTATIDGATRARVLAAALPSAAVDSVEIDAPFDEVWGWLSDLERSVPELDPTVGRIRILSKQGERWRVRARAPYVPLPLWFDVRMEEGYCFMRARLRLFLVIMTAAPLGPGRTRITHLEAIPLPFTRWLRPLLRWMVRADVRGMARHFEDRQREG